MITTSQRPSGAAAQKTGPGLHGRGSTAPLQALRRPLQKLPAPSLTACKPQDPLRNAVLYAMNPREGAGPASGSGAAPAPSAVLPQSDALMLQGLQLPSPFAAWAPAFQAVAGQLANALVQAGPSSSSIGLGLPSWLFAGSSGAAAQLAAVDLVCWWASGELSKGRQLPQGLPAWLCRASSALLNSSSAKDAPQQATTLLQALARLGPGFWASEGAGSAEGLRQLALRLANVVSIGHGLRIKLACSKVTGMGPAPAHPMQ